MTTQSQKRPIILAILVSLLIHLGILFLFVLHPNEYLPFTATPDNSRTDYEKLQTEWAATQARTSHKSAPVLFQDPTYDDNDQSDNETTTDDPLMPEQAEAIQQQEQSSVTDDTQSAPADSIKITSDPQLESVCLLETPVSKATDSDISSQEPQTNPLPAEQKTEHTVLSKTIQRTTLSSLSSTHSPSSQKRKIPTLAQLTQGFLEQEQTKEEENCAVTMLGKKGKPTDEQMKYEAYLHKLGMCLQNSFDINQRRLSTQQPCTAVVDLYLAINQDGTIRELRLAQSSGDIRLDEFTLFVMRDASSSFPPVPHYLPHDPFVIMYRISINTINASRIGIYRH